MMQRLFTFAALSLALLAAPALGETVAITGAKAWTGTDAGTLENATIVVTDGEITQVTTGDTALPEDARVIAAEGRWVTPGIIAPFTRIGIVEVAAEDATDDRRAPQSDLSVALKAAEGFNPAATTVDITRIEGVTRVVVAPVSGQSLFAGRGFIADTSGAPESVSNDDAFVFMSLGERGASLSGGSRPAAWTNLRGALSDARTFPARFLAHNEGDALTRMDAQAFGPAARGQQLILVEAQRASDLERLIAFATDNPELRFAVVGADEGWMVADKLAEAGIPVIVDPFQNLPASFEQLGASMRNAERLIAAGVTTAFAHLEDDGHQARLVLQSAGNAVANGVSHDDAMAAITSVPAEIFGLEGHGVIEAGAVGDLVVWDGDPLEVMSNPDVILIEGALQSLESRQTRLRDRYLALESGDRPFAYKRGGPAADD